MTRRSMRFNFEPQRHKVKLGLLGEMWVHVKKRRRQSDRLYVVDPLSSSVA